MRTRALILAAALTVGGAVAVPALAATGTRPVSASPCSGEYDEPSGDGYVAETGPTDPGLDVTHVALQVTKTTFLATLTVPGLQSTPPVTVTGDVFGASANLISPSGTSSIVSWEYWRSHAQGGGPNVSGSAYSYEQTAPGVYDRWFPAKATHVVADFEAARHQVRLTIPRAEVPGLLGASSLNGYTIKALYGYSENLGEGHHDFHSDYFVDAPAGLRPISLASCDSYLARGRKPVSTPCVASYQTATGNEDAPTGTLVPVRPDDLDVVSHTWTVSRDKVQVVVRLARLGTTPVFGDGREITLEFDRRATRTYVDLLATSRAQQVTGLVGATAKLDVPSSTVTFTLPRAALGKAVLLKPEIVTTTVLGGMPYNGADEDAYAPAGRIDLGACDSWMSAHGR